MRTLRIYRHCKYVDLSFFDRALWFATAFAASLIVARIVHQRLFTAPFDAFVLMLGVVIARDVALARLRYDSHPYVVIWELSLPVLLVAQLFAGARTLASVSRLYPGFGMFALKLFLTCLALTLACCCLGLHAELHRLTGEEAYLRTFFLAQRWSASIVAGTLILASLSLLRSPAPPKQPSGNLVLHTVLLSILFSGYSALFFCENTAPLGAFQVMERAQFCLVVVLYVIWAACLSSRKQSNSPWPAVDAFVFQKLSSPVAGGMAGSLSSRESR
jgi:hypothetical protein